MLELKVNHGTRKTTSHCSMGLQLDSCARRLATLPHHHLLSWLADFLSQCPRITWSNGVEGHRPAGPNAEPSRKINSVVPFTLGSFLAYLPVFLAFFCPRLYPWRMVCTFAGPFSTFIVTQNGECLSVRGEEEKRTWSWFICFRIWSILFLHHVSRIMRQLACLLSTARSFGRPPSS